MILTGSFAGELGAVHLRKILHYFLHKSLIHKLLHGCEIVQFVAFPKLKSLFVKPRLKFDGELVVHFEDRDFQGRVVNVSNYPHGSF